jgi:alpha-N-arabinofuranosidase
MVPAPRLPSRRSPARLAAAVLLAAVAAALPARAADPGKLTVRVDQPGAKFHPLFYGLMTEEINHSYDGGLYGELIQNRIFKDAHNPPGPGRGRGQQTPDPNAPPPARPVAPHWSVVAAGGKGAIALDTSNPVNTTALTTSLRLDITDVAAGQRVGVANDGYWGIPVTPDTTYKASFYARADTTFSGPLTVTIESNDGNTVYATGTVPQLTGAWQKYSLTLKTGQATPTANTRFVIAAGAKGSVWLNLVSLFPPTFNDRPNGNRVDLMRMLGDMKPAFLRFPGGNYVEGNTFNDYFVWKKTLGPLEERPGHMAPWTYRSTDGMGLLEFLLWCEDLKVEPVLAVFAGHILGNGNTSVTGPELEPYIKEALEEIEYVIGDVNTEWGARRAKDGHPEPFKLRFVEIGNEDNLSNGQPSYVERFTRFSKAIKDKYPQLQTISTVPTNVRNFNGQITPPPDVIDDHYYFNNIPTALNEAKHYDRYDRTGPKIFVGEWATRVGSPTPNFGAALGDAAFLTGLERNADLIIMSCYAPLFVHVGPQYTTPEGYVYRPGMQWATDLIGYDALRSFGSTSYYLQKMFAENRGDTVLPFTLAGVPDTIPTPPSLAPAAFGRGGAGGGGPGPAAPAGGPGAPTPAATAAAVPPTTAPAAPPGRGRGPAPIAAVAPVFVSATRVDATGEVVLKVVNVQETAQPLEITLQGVAGVGDATGQMLAGGISDVNTLAEPTKVAPKPVTVTAASPTFSHEFPAQSITVLKVKTR